MRALDDKTQDRARKLRPRQLPGKTGIEYCIDCREKTTATAHSATEAFLAIGDVASNLF
jgi:hypothetical protein